MSIDVSRKRVGFAALVAINFALAANLPGQQPNRPIPLNRSEGEQIISAFTAKEAEFRKALNQYSFNRDAIVQSLGMGGQVIGEYRRVSYFTFDDQGNRYEKISFFPMPSFGG